MLQFIVDFVSHSSLVRIRIQLATRRHTNHSKMKPALSFNLSSSGLVIYLVVLLSVFEISNAKTFEEDISLSSKEKRLLDKFRDRVVWRLPHDYMKQDIYLIKWLRSSHFDLDLAESNLIGHLQWRKERRMDTIHQEDWSDMYDKFRYYTEGRDKLGRPVLYFDVGTIDTRATVVAGKGERLVRYVERGIDEGCSIVREFGNKYKNMTRGHLFINVQGFNIAQHYCLQCIPFFLRMVLAYENHYPECIDTLVAVNTPSTIEALLAAVKPLLSQESKDSLRIFGTNRRVWKPILEKDFDFDSLPPAVGGTKIYKGMEDDYSK